MSSGYALSKRWVWCALSVMMAVLLIGEVKIAYSADLHSFAESAQGEPLAEYVAPEEEEEPGDSDEASLWAMLLANHAPADPNQGHVEHQKEADEAHIGGIFRPPRSF